MEAGEVLRRGCLVSFVGLVFQIGLNRGWNDGDDDGGFGDGGDGDDGADAA